MPGTSSRSCLWPVLFLLTLSCLLPAQSLIQTIAPPAGHRDFGWSTDRLSDLDGDGVPEIAAGHALGVDIVSAGAGSVLRTIVGGARVVSLPDLDGDGLRDVVSLGRLISGAGELAARSPTTGAVIWTVPFLGADVINVRLFRVADIDGDAFPDLIAITGRPGVEVLEARSGQSGTVIWSRGRAAVMGDPKFDVAVGLDDVNGDGVDDLALAADVAAGAGVHVVDGVTGATLRVFTPLAGERLGFIMTRIPDIDGDGVEDVAVYSDTPFVNGAGRQILYFSPVTGARIGGFPTLQTLGGPPRTLVRVPDIDGDGLDDLVETGSIWTSNYFGAPLGYIGFRSLLTGRWLRMLTGRPSGGGDLTVGITWLPLASNGAWPLFATGILTDGIALMDATPIAPADGVVWQIAPELDERAFATSVRVVGDANGDGFADYAVGVPRVGRSLDARVVLINGRTGARLATTAPGAARIDAFLGHTLVTIGDLDGDGVQDLVAGQQWPGALVLSGRTLAMLGSAPGSFGAMLFGPRVTTVGDQDGDGIEEVLLSDVPTAGPVGVGWAGGAAVWSPGSGTVLRTHVGRIGTSDNLGTAAAGIGDRDGDGLSEYAVGSPELTLISPSGFVSIHDASGTVIETIISTGSERGFGAALASGDLDGDGWQDLVVGAPDTDVGLTLGAGRVVLMRGGPLGFTRGWVRDGSRASGAFGNSVRVVSDLDGDRLPEIAVLQPRWANTAGGIGRVVILRGSDGTTLREIDNPVGVGWPGADIDSVPDRDGDGVDELLIGVPGAESPGGPHGSLWLVSGAPTRFAGVRDLGGGCSVAGATSPRLGATRPVLARRPGALETLRIELASGPASGTATLFVGLPPASPFALGGGCFVHVDPASWLVLPPVALDSRGRVIWPVGLPAEPVLAGAALNLQAVSVNQMGQPDLSNAIELRFGY